MDVIFEIERGRPAFFIEMGFFETVLEMKEKIEKYQGIPISKQTLVINGEVLQDDRDVAYCIVYCELLQDSRIQLIIAEDHESNHQQSPNIVIEDTKKIQLNIRIIPTSYSKTHVISIEMDSNDTIATLKEKIQEKESIHVNRLALYYLGKEMQDTRSLCDYEVSDNVEIDIRFKPLQSTVSVANRGELKKLRLTVLSKCRTQKTDVEVNVFDKVRVLRKEVEKLKQKGVNFDLPDEYFFIYNQSVMDDNRSFLWHHVRQGGTIEVFRGGVTSIS